jgi:type VI secretion system secreted protein VgrG
MSNEAEFLSPLGDRALLFRRLQGTEELGRMPEYRLDLLRLSTSTPIEASKLLGQRANVRVELAPDKYRYLNGVVTRFEHGGASGRFDIYHVEMRPWLWHLTLGADCRIFQDKSATEILDSVFNEYGSSSQIEKRLKGSFRKRPYTVQYRESDFAFVSRLMEEEGIYYYFKHEKDKHTLVLCNGPTGHNAIEDGALAWAAQQTGSQLREDVVKRWSRAHSLRSLKYVHTDVAPDLPTADLQGSALRNASYPKPNDLEVFDYPGGYEDLAMDGRTGVKRAEGDRLAQLRVDAFESGHVVATGLTPYRQMATGATFNLTDHPDAGGYLVTRTVYDMEYTGYEANDDTVAFTFDCRFTAVPKEVKFQPQPLNVRSAVHGPQTATVVGPSGDEIHTDKFGRVKLQFHWDRVGKKNEKSSCWVRVSHPWASKQFGMIALPRIGDEVVVEFLEGNPDRPLVTGRVYNGDNMPPYTLPAQQTVSGIKSQSSKGGGLSNFNELRFDDKKDAEYVWFQAEKDFHRLVKNDAFDSIGNDLWVDIKKNAAHKVGENFTMDIGKVATVSVGKDTHVTMGADCNVDLTGALNVSVGDNVAVYGAEAVAMGVGGALDVDVGQAAKLSAASSIHVKGLGIVIDGGAQLTIKAGGSFVTLGPEGVSIKGALVMINSGGAAGTAGMAKKASPAKPKEPAKGKENKDPLAS